MKIRLHFLFVLCLSLLAVFGSQLVGLSSAHAASVSSDPLVVVAVDVTAQTRCALTKTMNLGSPYEFTVHQPCAEGTIIMSQNMPLSQAVATHKRYIRLPSSQASPTTWEQTDQAIESLMRSEGASILKQLGKDNFLPQSPCGTSTHWIVNWYPDGDSITSGVQYYKYSSCTNIALDYSSVQGFTSYHALWWDHDQYASGWWGTGCPFVGTNYHSHDINSNQPVGYYFEPWLKDNACIWGEGTFWYTNIGPLD